MGQPDRRLEKLLLRGGFGRAGKVGIRTSDAGKYPRFLDASSIERNVQSPNHKPCKELSSFYRMLQFSSYFLILDFKSLLFRNVFYYCILKAFSLEVFIYLYFCLQQITITVSYNVLLFNKKFF